MKIKIAINEIAGKDYVVVCQYDDIGRVNSTPREGGQINRANSIPLLVTVTSRSNLL